MSNYYRTVYQYCIHHQVSHPYSKALWEMGGMVTAAPRPVLRAAFSLMISPAIPADVLTVTVRVITTFSEAQVLTPSIANVLSTGLLINVGHVIGLIQNGKTTWISNLTLVMRTAEDMIYSEFYSGWLHGSASLALAQHS